MTSETSHKKTPENAIVEIALTLIEEYNRDAESSDFHDAIGELDAELERSGYEVKRPISVPQPYPIIIDSEEMPLGIAYVWNMNNREKLHADLASILKQFRNHEGEIRATDIQAAFRSRGWTIRFETQIGYIRLDWQGD